MVYESYYWRKELTGLAKKLAKRISYKRPWTDSQNGAFEKEIMIGFYMIRKLIEAKKLTNRIVSTRIAGKKYPNIGKNVTLHNNHRFHEFYEFENPKVEKFDLAFLINQIIHSYIFSPNFSFSEKEILDKFGANEELPNVEVEKIIEQADIKLVSIYFCSDDKRNSFLYELELEKIIQLFEKVGNCHVTTIHRIYNEKKKDYDTFQSDEEVPVPPDIEEIIEQYKKK